MTAFLEFKKIENDNKTKYKAFYSHSKEEKIINVTDIEDVFESISTAITSKIKNNF